MTFIQVKDLLLNNARRREICDLYAELEAATNYETFIWTALSLFEWSWRTGIIDATILNEIPDADLIAQGIYYNKVGALILNPTKPYSYKEGKEVWLIGGSPVISITTGDIKINSYSSNPTITSSNNSFLDLKGYNSIITVNSENDSIVQAEFRNNNSEQVSFTMKDNSQVGINIEAYTILTLNKTGTPFCVLNTYNNSIANIIFSEDNNVLHSNAYQSSQINYEIPQY